MKKTALLIGSVLLLSMTGCGDKTEEPVVTVEKIDEWKQSENEKNDTKEENASTDNGEEAENENTSINNSEEASMDDDAQGMETIAGTEELEGSVESIGENSVVINKIFVTKYDDGSQTAVEMVEVGTDGKMITVNFSENTVYELQTVRNKGVNGDSDVTSSEGSFSDISKGATLKLTGYYISQDKEFMADSVIMYNFI